MFDKVLVANRGAIAVRIMRTLGALNAASVAVYTGADSASLHVDAADEAVRIGDGAAADSYLDAEKILAAARETGAAAIHPGYGFLSENADFARACTAADIVFLGPTPDQIRDFGLKHTARELASNNEIPMLPGSDLLDDAGAALAAAGDIGYPVMLKSTAGGGGIGMRLCHDAAELQSAFTAVKGLGERNFGDGGVFLEKFIFNARHIEVQIFGDGAGRVISLGERDCSLQRRNQKVIEETPAPNIGDSLREQLADAAERLGAGVDYRSAGTVEFVFDVDAQAFYFLEVNTRLQVEHGVTERVTGIDLVAWMLHLGAGEIDAIDWRRPAIDGHAIQARVYAENPGADFAPSTGRITHLLWPDAIRCDSWVAAGAEVSPFYDPLLAKLIAHADSRETAIADLRTAIMASRVDGVTTNLEYLAQVLADDAFLAGNPTTRHLNDFRYHSRSIAVIAPGTHTTVQAWPGRTGYWDVGIPPSGPMDDYAFRLANRLLDNATDAAGLECTASGPTLRFDAATTIALTGADMQATLDGERLPRWQAIAVPAGATLIMGEIDGAGARAYLAVAGGIDVPEHMGSRATFTLGTMGGHGGRALRAGDVLPVSPRDVARNSAVASLGAELIPDYGKRWEIAVIYGPHGAPDYFTPADIERFFDTDWQVHYQSSRTGVRLNGPKPEWARADGGEAGLHPSNIHDNAYAVGTVDFTGDMPIILGPDGPSLGGFVCPSTVIEAERWKLGQLAAGDTLRFVPVSQDEARTLAARQRDVIERLAAPAPSINKPVRVDSPTLARIEAGDHPVGVVYRPAGDCYLLVEYGDVVLDIALRFRVHALMLWLQDQAVAGLAELTPGVRSLQIHYDPDVIDRSRLLDLLMRAEDALGDVEDQALPSRIVHLPLAWNHSSIDTAIERYDRVVRADAPWAPSNIEFIRRINGLNSIDEVQRILFDARYLVMGLGDVYLSAPLATPVDPRHRLVTTKYNPARTWTPENAVGIGGAYMCIYGMEGPGGYQLVGRTLQIWNRYRRTPVFEQPHLLRFFDQIRYFPVEEAELDRLREDFPRGRYAIDIEDTEFDLRVHQRFLADNAASIEAFKNQQQTAFEAERQRWAETGQDQPPEPPKAAAGDDEPLADNEVAVESHVQGSLVDHRAAAGDGVAAGDTVAVLESMKMEIEIAAPEAGVVARTIGAAGALVAPGQRLLVIRVDKSGD